MTTRTMPATLLLALMIALVACNGSAPQDAPAPEPTPEPTPATSPAQTTSAIPASTPDPPASGATDAVPAADGARPATRCGWFENPTPGNAWLNDRDGSWTIGTQGGPQADGEWPSFDDGQWIVTNGSSYGYGCACMSVTVDAPGHRILTIQDARAQPLSRCRDDPALEEPPRP